MSLNLSQIDGGLLLALDALLQDLNVTHAAQRLNLSQPALSARLVRLRELFGDQLLVPAGSGRGMVLTPHAAALRPELTRLIAQLTEFTQVASLFDPATSRRTFRIAATDNPSAILAPDLIPLIEAQAPNVRLAFMIPDKSRIVADLEDGRYDLCIGAAEDGSSDLIQRTLFEEEFVTAQRIGHPRGKGPLTLDEFCAYDHLLISTDGGGFAGKVDRVLASMGRERRVSLSVQSYALTPVFLGSSDCLCTLPRRFLERFEDKLDLFETPLPLDKFGLYAFWHQLVRNDPAHIWLRERLFQAAEEASAAR